MRILITGSAGAIGTTLVKGLRDRHQLRGLDCEPTPDLEDSLVGDIGDFDLLLEATRDMEGVIHLVNVPGGEWEHSHQSMVGTYNVFETARINGVQRVAYASRAGVFPQSHYPRTLQRTADMPTRPESYYTLSKVFGEGMGYLYHARHGMGVVGVRIGNFNRNRDQPEHPHQLSHGDCVHLFEQCLIHPGVGFELVFGVSDSDWPLYDLDHGRKVIGYYPKDRSIVPEEERT